MDWIKDLDPRGLNNGYPHLQPIPIPVQQPGWIRGDGGDGMDDNLIHRSDKNILF